LKSKGTPLNPTTYFGPWLVSPRQSQTFPMLPLGRRVALPFLMDFVVLTTSPIWISAVIVISVLARVEDDFVVRQLRREVGGMLQLG
jgi:hypothetical protein